MSMDERLKARVIEETVLSKYEGDPVPQNEFERIHIRDGVVVAIHKIEDGNIVATETLGEVT